MLTPKDISGVLAMIGIHPAMTPDAIDKPTHDSASSAYLHLSEFAYDMDPQQLKAQVSRDHQTSDIYNDVIDLVTVFKLTKQLAAINHIEDFSLKDFWEPSSKRFRTVLSGIINFCRYKEVQAVVTNGMKENLQAQDGVRLELVQRSNQLELDLAAAQEQHSNELHAMWAAENDVQELRTVLDRLRRQRQTADRVLEETEAKLTTAKERGVSVQEDIARTKEKIEGLRDQVAESPEGLEREIEDLQQGVGHQKAQLEERSQEKRARLQRDQVFAKLMTSLERYRDELAKAGQAAAVARAAQERTQAAREDLKSLQASLEASRGEVSDFEQAVMQTTGELERSKEDYEERVQKLDERRRQALLQQEGLQAKRSEDQKRLHALQAQRIELEAELASHRRAHEAEMNGLRARHRAVFEKGEVYDQQIDMLVSQYDNEMGRATSPDEARARRVPSCSPSPARSTVGRWTLPSAVV